MDFMLGEIGSIAGYLGTALGAITSVVYFRRARRAEVLSKEIGTADQMIDLVKKANAEVYELNRKENEKLRNVVSRLEKAIREINRCANRDECPVTVELQDNGSDYKG